MSSNGRLSASELTSVDGVQLANRAAGAWTAMQAACLDETGIELRIVLPAGGYRSYFVQGDMKVHPALYNLNPASSVNLASPGYSKHGDGLAVDVSTFTGARRDWVLANMGRFGFSRPFGESDPNHLLYDGVALAPASTTSKPYLPPAEPTKEPTMKNWSIIKYVVGTGYTHWILGEGVMSGPITTDAAKQVASVIDGSGITQCGVQGMDVIKEHLAAIAARK